MASLEEEIKQTKFASAVHKAVVNVMFTNNWFSNELRDVFKNHQLTNQQYFNCLTCYPSCETKIGLFQPKSTCSKKIYYIPGQTSVLEQECLPPTSWKYPSL
jgi:hypothetical protein